MGEIFIFKHLLSFSKLTHKTIFDVYMMKGTLNIASYSKFSLIFNISRTVNDQDKRWKKIFKKYLLFEIRSY